MKKYTKKGYLQQGFRIFQIEDSSLDDIPFHYHDFHKILFFLSGDASYIIEGKTYPLAARDILLINAGEIHRPIIRGNYQRIIIYVDPGFLQNQGKGQWDLEYCFKAAKKTSHLLHSLTGQSHDLLFHIRKLAQTSMEKGYAQELYAEILFTEFMILLNRALLEHELLISTKAVWDTKTQEILEYINLHLTENLSLKNLANSFYLSPHHMMRKFKASTGCSIHQYIIKKRIHMAKKLLLSSSLPVGEIASKCGFNDYSSFSREFKRSCGCSPRDFRK